MQKAGILIVEDSFIVAFHLQKTLESEGYTIVGTETSGEAALKLLESKKPDLVLMDIMLSGKLDGIETTQKIRSIYNLPVIYITALTDKETIQRAKITEPYGYLTKPFEDREIFTVIEMALYRHEIQSKLKQSEERFFSTVRSISDAVVVTDANNDITYLNPNAERLTGWLLSEAANMNAQEILVFLQENTREFIPDLRLLAELEATNQLKWLLLVARDGRKTPVGISSISPVIGPKGKLLGSVLIFKDISEKLEHERLVKDMEKKRLSALLEGQEKERSRIAKDLHDGLGQMLNAIKMNLNLLQSEDQRVNELYKLIDEAIQESVRISENLLPAKLKDFDLATCLKSLCNQASRSVLIPIEFESLSEAIEVDQTQKINFYRIAQEAINNAIKHAQAKSIHVQLSDEGNKIQLLVEDDGVGIQAGKNNGTSMGHGLANMRDRAEMMGGKLIVESDHDRGTLILVEAPVTIENIGHVKA